MVRRILTAVLAMLVLTTGAVAETEPYPGLTWESTLLDALLLPQEDGFAAVMNDEALGSEYEIMLVGRVGVGDYTADAALLEFEADKLTGVFYCIAHESSDFAFQNLDAYFRRLYGEPACFDPNKISIPGFVEKLEEAYGRCQGYYASVGNGTVMGLTGLTRKGEVTEFRVWEIDENTQLSIGYYKAGKIWKEQYISVAFTGIPNE